MQQEKKVFVFFPPFNFQGKEYAVNSINADSRFCKLTTILWSGCTVDVCSTKKSHVCCITTTV